MLKNRHPRSVSVVPSLNSLFLWTSRVSGHVFHLFNSLGDCFRYETFKISLNFPVYIVPHFSQNTTVELVDQVIADSDSEVIQKRDEVEDMWRSCLSKRERKTLSSHHCPGYTLGGDNVGK